MNYPKVTVTITTGRRLELFKRTIQSFRECCRDHELIESYLLCDDRSEDIDIKRMGGLYPFIEIERSTVAGQPHSLNNLFRRTRTEWVFHLEDDWQFLQPFKISDLFDIAFDDDRIKNVIMRDWRGVLVNHNGLQYSIHTFRERFPVPKEEKWDITLRNDHTWYGYSLNPGILHLPTIRSLGTYNEDYNPDGRGWDKEHAIKYREAGFKRANIIGEYISHIGQDRSYYRFNRRIGE